jgi:hypothetical protein
MTLCCKKCQLISSLLHYTVHRAVLYRMYGPELYKYYFTPYNHTVPYNTVLAQHCIHTVLANPMYFTFHL